MLILVTTSAWHTSFYNEISCFSIYFSTITIIYTFIKLNKIKVGWYAAELIVTVLSEKWQIIQFQALFVKLLIKKPSFIDEICIEYSYFEKRKLK